MLPSVKSRFSSGMVALIALLWASQLSSVATTISPRYGGALRRPIQKPFFAQHAHAFPSPTHSYPIFHRPQPIQPFRGVRFPAPVPQQYTPALTSGFVQTAPHQHQTVFYPNNNQKYLVQPQQISYQTLGTSASYQQTAGTNQISYAQPSNSIYDSGFKPQTTNIYASPSYTSTVYGTQSSSSYVPSSSSSTYGITYPYTTGNVYGPSTSGVVGQATGTHFHVTSNKLVQDGTSGTTGTTTLSEPCTNNHWTPLGSSSVTGTTGSASVQQPQYFFGGSISTPVRPVVAPAYVRYQPHESTQKVVVLSQDVLKTLLANSKSPPSTSNHVSTISQANGDHIASASNLSPTTVPANSIVSTTANGDEQPSVKLVGYIAPATDNTPTGYIQVPISKQMMETLSGSGSNYDFAMNSSKYSLFTLKSVNDVDSLFGLMKSQTDNEASASYNVPLGLVVKAHENQELKSSASSANVLLYPVDSSSSSGANGGGAGAIQMVGHVQITSPDISTHFSKRQDPATTS